LEKKGGIVGFHLKGNGMHFGKEFITHNNVLIEGHNRLVRIPSKNGVIWVKAHEVLNVGGSTINLMLGKKLWKKNAWEVMACCV
jgi:hypothetical protein